MLQLAEEYHNDVVTMTRVVRAYTYTYPRADLDSLGNRNTRATQFDVPGDRHVFPHDKTRTS